MPSCPIFIVKMLHEIHSRNSSLIAQTGHLTVTPLMGFTSRNRSAKTRALFICIIHRKWILQIGTDSVFRPPAVSNIHYATASRNYSERDVGRTSWPEEIVHNAPRNIRPKSTLWVIKRPTVLLVHNFGKCWPISK